MTTLAVRPVDEPDLLALIADSYTTLGKPFADKFRDACRAEADIPGRFDGPRPHGPVGYVNPNMARERLLDEQDYDPRRYSAQWAPACGRSGFLVKLTTTVAIAGEGSRGNGNKSVPWRRWVGES